MINIPLMEGNILKEDINEVINFLENTDRFTNGPKVRQFEEEFANWLSPEKKIYCLFVNSGSSANFLSLATIKEMYGIGEVILSPIGWESDVASVLAAGMKPVFVDVNLSNLACVEGEVIRKITDKTVAILLTHVLGYNGLTDKICEICEEKNILLIEDVCESIGATFRGQKCGTFGTISCFSFYYAHHMSTIEGGMVCTTDENIYRILRMLRSHGMLRECGNDKYIKHICKDNMMVYPEFMFMVPGYNMRNTEINAVIGLNQLKRLNDNIQRRRENYKLFIESLDKEKYYVDFDNNGNSNYAFVVILREKNDQLYEKLVNTLYREKVEYRRGTAGGGNLTRQPFIRKCFPNLDYSQFINAEHIHNYGLYTGNYPQLSKEKIFKLSCLLNSI